MTNRAAVSVVEILVALVVFSIGALGSAAAIASAARAQSIARARRESVAALQARATALALAPCATLANGGAVEGGVPIAWVVTRSDSLVRVTLHADYRHSFTTLRTEFACE